ncbi:16S rRNA (uracil(1498)-N(3))-methyltransferase [Anaerovorax odorimutans]|uniref:Ribosomal RNA small subunit methyltransferase E n=1 Tax=Anaerovorax odorimutans TaxID=109327 RepID=A0ABT1RLK2_9FIRM|nr:16S rRNA (uracil(1498)-N(3))-methyltransferase [Anaerovorax odorimutans]MCQ4636047.1 16S rRNA (uracil(1498)-N(3))-methyltransferase [Anaerovorax odorimutans]
MSRFFVDAADVGESTIRIVSKEDIRHIAKVLRLGEGDRIEVSDSTQWEYEAEILTVDDDCVEAKILDKQKFAREPQVQVTLFQGIPKQSKMETVVQKCVEMGVYRIVPVFTERTVVTDKGNFSKKRQRWQKVSAEAVKQCRRGIVPEIGQEIKFRQMTEHLREFDLVLFPYENETGRTIKDSLRGLDAKPGEIALIIGPEGGFSHGEAQALKDLGADCVTLGRTILRTETAGLAALSMIMYELEL